jgi:hypothetical protein
VAEDPEQYVNRAVEDAMEAIAGYGRDTTVAEIMDLAHDSLDPGEPFDRWDEVARVILQRFDLPDGTGDDEVIPQEKLEQVTGASPNPWYEEAEIRSHLAALSPAALAELRRKLEASPTDRTLVVRPLPAGATGADLATLIAMADTDGVVRVRLCRAIGEVQWEREWQ